MAVTTEKMRSRSGRKSDDKRSYNPADPVKVVGYGLPRTL
jgi:hypothetical protein